MRAADQDVLAHQVGVDGQVAGRQEFQGPFDCLVCLTVSAQRAQG